MSASSFQRLLFLDYLREYPIGGTVSPTRRKTKLHFDPRIVEQIHQTNGCTFPWHQARQLEGRLDAPSSEGVWPIDHWRVERRFGNPGADAFPRSSTLNDATPETYEIARRARLLAYRRTLNTDEAIAVVSQGAEVRYATAITSDWYDPEDGVIKISDSEPEILGSHGVPIAKYDSAAKLFRFPNSWGWEWGNKGWGAIDTEHFQRFMIEAWKPIGLGLSIPTAATRGVICLEWKWSLTNEINIHGREIVDASTNDRLAWAFCARREQTLDVEEFFVWPSERGKGYGHELARMVLDLANTLGVPLRMLVSFADTYEDNLDAVGAVARMLHLNLYESNDKAIHLAGEAVPATLKIERTRPQRPAFMLELLRPKDEAPIAEETKYVVLFGTNRRPADLSAISFTGERDSKLNLGAIQVTIPRTFRFGSRGRFWQRAWNWLVQRHPRIISTELFSDAQEFETRASQLSSYFGDEAHNLLFVHGFNVSFSAAAIQAAQFAVDLKLRGAAFLFSWPSAGSLTHYHSDEATIEASTHYLEDYLKIVLESTGSTPLSVIVHSMGNRAIVRLLENAARGICPWLRDRLRHVIFAAPDVDAEVFASAAKQFAGIPKRTTLYATRADLALQASEIKHRYNRAGLFPPVVTVPGMDTVLVDGFNLLDLGHSYYAAASDVLHDMFMLIHSDLPPNRRPKIVSVTTHDGQPYWKLPLI